MPDLRLNTHRIGTEYQRRLTFKCDGTDILYDETQPGGSDVVGRAVMLSGNGIVRLVGEGNRVLGKLILVEAGNVCTVLVGGGGDLLKGDGAIAAGDRIVGNTRTGAARTTRGFVRGVVAATAADVAQGAHVCIDNTSADSIEVNFEG